MHERNPAQPRRLCLIAGVGCQQGQPVTPVERRETGQEQVPVLVLVTDARPVAVILTTRSWLPTLGVARQRPSDALGVGGPQPYQMLKRPPHKEAS
ncbi:hypothetical protein D3C84_174950 [compost metagenome]